MNPVTAQQKVDFALQRAKDLRSSTKSHGFHDRHREKVSVYTPYQFRGVHVKRVAIDPEREFADKVRGAIAASRANIYDRLRAHFGSGDDCGCEN